MKTSSLVRRMRVLLVSVAALSACTLPSLAQQSDDAPEALVAAALAEGGFTFYTSSSEAVVSLLVSAFEEQYPGINVNVLRLPSGALNTRYGTEVASSVFEADLFNSATTDLFDLHKEWWQPMTQELVPNLVNWPESATAEVFLHASFSEHGLVYNTELLDTPPATWEEVLDAEYQGKCLMIDPRTSPTFVSFYDMLRTTYGDEFLTRLGQQNCTIAAAGLPTSQEVGAGGGLIGFPVTASQVSEPAAMGAPIGRVTPAAQSPTPAHGIVQYYGVPAQSAHPNAARLYLNWFLSGAAQQLECDTGGYASPHPDVTGCAQLSDKFYPARSDVPAESRSRVLTLLGLGG